jgi:NAD(P)-dependent dehydrogenase (short-subunit alcohol dehydrogenase family)
LVHVIEYAAATPLLTDPRCVWQPAALTATVDVMNTSTKVALVTGGNKGIGRHIVRQLAQHGVHVYLGARDEERGRAAAGLLTDEGLPVEFVQLDVTDTASAAAAAGEVALAMGRLDILVNNAAITSGLDGASTMRAADLRRTYDTNVFGVAIVTNAFLPLLNRSSSPRIVNVSSAMGSIALIADPEFELTKINQAAYQSSKAAVNALTVLYANELRPAGVKVNAVCPGYRATELNGGLPTPGAGDPAEGAKVAVTMALIDDDGPTAQFVGDTGDVYPW